TKVAVRHVSILLVKGLVSTAKVGLAVGHAIWNFDWLDLPMALRSIIVFLVQVALIPVYRGLVCGYSPSRYQELAILPVVFGSGVAAAVLGTAYLQQAPSPTQ